MNRSSRNLSMRLRIRDFKSLMQKRRHGCHFMIVKNKNQNKPEHAMHEDWGRLLLPLFDGKLTCTARSTVTFPLSKPTYTIVLPPIVYA